MTPDASVNTEGISWSLISLAPGTDISVPMPAIRNYVQGVDAKKLHLVNPQGATYNGNINTGLYRPRSKFCARQKEADGTDRQFTAPVYGAPPVLGHGDGTSELVSPSLL